MSRAAHFRTSIDFDGARLATVTIDRELQLFTVRLLRRRRTYTLPLGIVAQICAWKVTKAEFLERKKAKKKGGRRG